MAKRRWTDDEMLSGMAVYIREHAILPTAAEYMATRGDLPDESTIRERLGGWTAAWRRALRLVLDTMPRLRASSRLPAAERGRLIETVRQMRGGGNTLQQIGDHLGLSRERVRQICAEHGVEKPRRKHSPDELAEQVEAVRRLRSQGKTVASIVASLGVTVAQVQQICREHDIPVQGIRQGRNSNNQNLWHVALRQDWPMTAGRLGEALYPRREDARSLAAMRLIYWTNRGWIVRFGRGMYDLTPEARAVRESLLVGAQDGTVDLLS